MIKRIDVLDNGYGIFKEVATGNIFVWDDEIITDRDGKEYKVVDDIRDEDDNVISFIVENN